jgi:hypothetical protein
MYMVYADRLSGFPFVKEWRKDPNPSEVLKEVRRYFVNMGLPVQMRTDGGPQFAAKEFRDFLKKWGVDSVLSTPHYPQTNGHAELSVKAMKNLVIKTSGGDTKAESFRQGLLEFRNTPRSYWTLSSTGGLQTPDEVHGPSALQVLCQQVAAYGCRGRREGSKAAPLTEGELRQVRSTDRAPQGWTGGVDPTSCHQEVEQDRRDHQGRKNRDYQVKLPSGRLYWRNRRCPRKMSSDESKEPKTTRDRPCKKADNDDPTEESKEPRRGTRLRKKTVHFGDM